MEKERKLYQEWSKADVLAYLEQATSEPQLQRLRSLVEEVEQMQRVPGIAFADSATGRRAKIGGTGVNVYVIIRDYLDYDRDWSALTSIYDWLSPEQLNAALAYYAAFPDEIDERIALDDAFARAFDRPKP